MPQLRTPIPRRRHARSMGRTNPTTTRTPPTTTRHQTNTPNTRPNVGRPPLTHPNLTHHTKLNTRHTLHTPHPLTRKRPPTRSNRPTPSQIISNNLMRSRHSPSLRSHRITKKQLITNSLHQPASNTQTGSSSSLNNLILQPTRNSNMQKRCPIRIRNNRPLRHHQHPVEQEQ